jgi:hypothetical protein
VFPQGHSGFDGVVDVPGSGCYSDAFSLMMVAANISHWRYASTNLEKTFVGVVMDDY